MQLNKIRKRYRKLIDKVKPGYQVIYNLIHKKELEKQRSFGNKNPNQKIYIIRSNNTTAGMFSIINTVLEHLAYASEKKYIPVIDMKNYSNSYLDSKKKGKENSWEYYFLQPSECENMGISLEEAYQSKNVILSNMSPILPEYHFDSSICNDITSEKYKKYKVLFEKYIKMKKDLRCSYMKEVRESFEGKRVLGVLCRGTDYIRLKPYAHPIQPHIEDVLCLTEQKLLEWNCDYLYLSTEDEKIVKIFSERFCEKLIITKRDYYSEEKNGEKYITNIINQKTGARKAGEDYLKQIFFLLHCNSVILSRTSATPSILFAGTYEHTYIWNLGLYGVDD